MEKAQILSQLKANIGTTDARFDKTLEKFIDFKNLTAVADADLNLAQYTEDLKWQMEQAIGMANHEIAEARKNWQNTNPNPNPAPTPQPESMSAEVKAILDKQNETIMALANKLTGFETQKTADGLRSIALAEGNKLKANPKLWEMAVQGVEIKADTTGDSLLAAVKPAYEALQKSVFGDTAAPYGNTAPDDPSAATKATLDAFFADKPGFESKKQSRN